MKTRRSIESRAGAARSGVHEIIVNDANEFAVWPTERRLPNGWRHIGKSGTLAEMQAHLREMFVETVAAPLITRRKATADTFWGD